MDDILKKSLLYDFYGELLTEHQKSIYEDVTLNDLSLTEVADNEGISRQGVYDLIKRIDKKLMNYENKLHLIEKFEIARENVSEIKDITVKVLESEQDEETTRRIMMIARLADEILDEY
ncbi:MAG: DNA-binding protein [Lachnospiraceae bacterium]|nr:DNA-binding protein [Lachnospiraceae bacterium]